MRATTLLREEHEIILRGLRILATLADRAAEGAEIPAGAVDGLLDFLSGFADAHHHAKEEGILFPALEKAGLPRDAGPVAVMLHEHQGGRALIVALREAAERPDALFAGAARSYALLLAQHIEKENQILFPLADQIVGGGEGERVDQEFDAFEQGAGAKRVEHERSLAQLEKALASREKRIA